MAYASKLTEVLRHLRSSGTDNLAEAEYRLLSQAIAEAGGPKAADAVQLLRDRPFSTLIEFVLEVGSGAPCPVCPVCPPCPPCTPGVFTVSAMNSNGEFKLDHYNSSGNHPHNLITEVHFPNLVTIDSAFFLYNILDLTIADFPVLVGNSTNAVSGATGDFEINRNPALVTLNVPIVDVRQWSTINFDNNPALTTVDLSSSVWGPVTVANFAAPALSIAGCALSEATVNAILVRIASFLPFDVPGNVNVDLSGGTNAVPTGLGLAAYNALNTAGCIISTN